MSKSATLIVLSAIIGAVSSSSFSFAGDNSALQQLQKATSGDQSTGKTFDNNNHPQQMNAYPQGNTNVPSVSSGTAGGYSQPTSSGTAGGYNATPLNNTAKTPKKGTEKTN